MLLSLRNRLTVTLGPGHIAMVRTARGWRARSGQPEVVRFDSLPDQPDWQAPLAALDCWLQQHGDRSGDLHCILSDRFVRYALLPWSDNVQKAAEVQAFARIQFEAVLGRTVDAWDITIDRNEYGKAGIACAVDKNFVAALTALARENKARLMSVQPGFMQVFNRWRDRVHGDVLFATLEAGYCVLAVIKANAWHSIRTLKLESENPELALQRLIERECLLQGLGEASAAYVHITGMFDRDRLGQRITILEDASFPEGDGTGIQMVSAGGN